MVRLEEAVIARFSSHGMDFELLVDPELVLDFRGGQSVDLRSVLAVDKVFKDARKGEVASEEALKRVFDTTDVWAIAERIIRRGKVQVTTEQRRRMREERRKQIVSIISKRAINPQTGLPHPPARIEGALEQAGVNVDGLKSAEGQLQPIVKALRPILPLRFEMLRIAIKIPASYAGRASHAVRGFASLKREQWLEDGSWGAVVEIPAGVQAELLDKLNELTRGEVQTKVL